jgi:2-C-methyl-D-erythritol 2,4-cyclodiphosphate synthase
MSASANVTAKTVLFWISIVFLGLMCWRLITAKAPSGTGVAYTDFLQMVEDKQVRSAEIYLDSNTVKVIAHTRQLSEPIATTVTYGLLSSVIDTLRESGATVDVKQQKASDWVLILLNAAPLILLVGFCLFLMRQVRARTGMAAATATSALLSPSLSPASVTHCGIGYDLHRLEEGRTLIVGGIELPFDKGPVGHSDGDVLAHALCDALLGAAGLGDIGTHFPDTDPKWKGANSLIFLEHAKKLLDEKKLTIEHVDAVVITEKPKLGPHFPRMREALAKSLGVAAEKIHLKAKTNEGVDAIGRGEAIAAHVVATLKLL